MSDIAIPLQALTVPPATCLPQTAQDLVELMAQCLQVPLPDGYTQIVVSDSTPAPADNGRIWLKVDGSGNPLGFYKFAGGAWVAISPQNVFWATDGGTVNALSVTIPNYPNAALTNGMFVVQANNDNTGAFTLKVNAFAALSAKIAGQDPYAGAIRDGYWYIFSFVPGSPGTFEILNPTPKVQKPTLAGLWVYQAASGAAGDAIPAGDTTIPINTEITALEGATLGGNAVALGEGTYWIEASVYLTDTPGPSSGGVQLAIRNGGADVNWQDGVIGNIDESAQMTVKGIVVVPAAGSASITAQLKLSVGTQLTYGVDATSPRAERPASLTILKLA